MSAKSIKICGAAALVLLLLFAALGPAKWQVRTGLGWQFDHIAGYFAFTVLFTLAWRRPMVVGGILMSSGILLEALQALTPDRCCDFDAALYSAGGALAGALFAALVIQALKLPNWRSWAARAQSGRQRMARVTEVGLPQQSSCLTKPQVATGVQFQH